MNSPNWPHEPDRLSAGGGRSAKGKRRGFTTIEILVTSAILLIVTMVGQSLLFAATSGTVRTLRRDDSLRSVETVLELIRSDLNRMILVDPATDLAIHQGGRGLSFKIPNRDAADFWEVDCDVVSYSIEPIGAGSSSFRLVRKTPSGTTVIGGCTLKGLTVRLVSAGQIARDQSFLEVTVTGCSSDGGASPRWASALVPITVATGPLPYIVEVGR